MTFSALGSPKMKTFAISEFNGKRDSHLGFVLTESISSGKFWYYPEKNEYKGFPDFEKMVDQIMDGQHFDFNKLERKAGKFKH